MVRVTCVMLLAGLLAVTGCQQKTETPARKVTPDDVLRDAGKAAETAAEFSRQAVESFQKSLEVKLKDLDAEIDTLREKGSDLKDQAKADWDAKMNGLEKKRETLRAKLDEIGQSSAEAWKDLRKATQSAWDDLEKAFQEAADEFK